MIIWLSPANSQCEFAPNSQYCEFQAEFGANSRCERIRSEFGEFKLNSLRICIPTLGLTRVPTRCQQAVVALVGTLVHHRSTFVRAEVTKMFWEIAGAHRICPEVHYPVPEFATLAGGDWVHRIPRALAALGVGLYNPIACPKGGPCPTTVPAGQHRHCKRFTAGQKQSAW